MSVWGRLFGQRTAKLSSRDDAETVAAALSAGGSNAGKRVTPDSTLQLSTAWRCVRLKSRVVGALPIGVHERLEEGGSRPAKEHWLYELVHESPNADQTPAEFWAGQIACIDLWGNAFAEKKMLGDRVVALVPMRADRVRVRRELDGRRRYYYAARNGERILEEDQVFHLRGFTLGGDEGLSAISYGRHTLGLALASDETAAKTFANGLQLSGFLKEAMEGKSTPEQRRELMNLFAEFAGSSQTGKVMPLPRGWEFQPLGMKPGDAQLLESRGFNVEEVCRWFDTPPILVGHAGPGQTMWGSGVEQILLGWLTLDLDPLLGGIEQAVKKQLLSPAERRKFYAEYNREALLQADSAAKAAFLSTMVQNGLMDRNEGRGKLNLPKRPEAETLTVQSNLLPIDQLGKQPPRAVQPAPGEPI